MKRPLIHDFLENPLSGPEIEARSFELIDREAPAHGFTPDEWQVVRRMIHTTGDFAVMENVSFSPDAIASALAALRRGKPIFTDANMIRSGISTARLKTVFPGYSRESIICYVDDGEVARRAEARSLPRSLFAVQKAKPEFDGAIALFGNAPVALLEMNRLIMEENVRPALVVAMPVGFVHVRESKDELRSTAVPSITLSGRRGGSPLAVSVIHALCSLAAPHEIGETKPPDAANSPAGNGKRALIVLGHGSRASGAADDMERVAAMLKGKLDHEIIETCQMSGQGALFPEVFERCVRQGAASILVFPYFLHRGMHILHDVPRMMREKAAEFPGVKVVLGNNLGFDETIVEIVLKRIAESENRGDIRECEAVAVEAESPLPEGSGRDDRCAGKEKA
jgi:precorrin-8X/cobalt-precorrin-8 methylmutase